MYNALGQRVEKTVDGTTTVFVYDEAGHLLGEYTPTGALMAEHIWLGNRPIGVITPNGLYYVQTDQLGTPRAITNSSGQLAWQWQSDPFGTSTPNQNPSGLGTFTYNLRFPGQYYDAETGHNYNYFRYYDPTIGRFISSDPIGLRGGINTYAYVGNNPMSNKDPTGLMCVQGVGCWTTPAEAALADSGQYPQYYTLACADGDAYACFAGNVANDSNFWGHAATDWLLHKLWEQAKAAKECINESGILDQIRSDLAKDYANYLPQSESQARWPTVQGIEQMHWDEFAKFGLPPSTFGGTPLAPLFGPIAPGIWCPNCK